MPIRRFEDFEDARRALWVDCNDPDLVPRIRRLWAFAHRLSPVRVPLGVRKFESIEAANRERDARTARRVRELREARARAELRPADGDDSGAG